jgi:hypothetical protein
MVSSCCSKYRLLLRLLPARNRDGFILAVTSSRLSKRRWHGGKALPDLKTEASKSVKLRVIR